jgi:putative redox protein
MAAKSKIRVLARLGDKFRVESDIHGNTVCLDQPRETGGENSGPNPLEATLCALAGCIAHLARIIAHQRKIDLRSLKADVEGQIDKGFLLGKTREGRAGFTKISARVSIDADLTPEEKEEFLSEIARRCPVSDNLSSGTDVGISLEG